MVIISDKSCPTPDAGSPSRLVDIRRDTLRLMFAERAKAKWD
jgi:hypothetical protein